MAKGYYFSPQALRDRNEIIEYIASHNPYAARKLKSSINAALKKLGVNPYIGQKRSDLTPKPVRFWPVTPNYLIIYNAEKQPVEILRIYSAARNSDDLL